jgi:hypothetical protein
MAIVYGMAMSNRFRVKNRESFKSWAEKQELEVQEDDGLFSVRPMDEGTWPIWIEDPETGEDITEHFTEEFAAHLVDGSVAIFMEIAHEGMRTVAGVAFALNSKGQTRRVDLDDIYKKAEKLGSDVRRVW